MRDILVVSVFAVGVLMALRRPWLGVMLWTWISLMSPHRYCYGFAYDAPLAAIAAALLLFGVLVTRERENPIKGAPVKWLIVLAIWITLSWLLGYGIQSGDVVLRDRDYELWGRVMKIFLILLVSLALLRNRFQIITFAWITGISLAIAGAKGGVFTIGTGFNYHVYGPPGSQVYDNNDFALALAMLIPLLYFLYLQIKSGAGRLLMLAVILLCLAASFGSQSRGGFLALAAMGTVLLWRSPHRGGLFLALLVVTLIILPMLPEEWWERMHSITDYSEDESSMGRIRSWKVALQVALHHVMGAGMYYQHPIIFAKWDVDQGDLIAAHSIYFQILGNHGFIGLFLYIMVGVSTFRTAGWLRKNARNIPQAQWAAHLGSMVQVSMAGFAVGGAFLSMAYYDLQFNVMALVVLARHWVETKGWEREPEMGFLEHFGLRSPRPRPPVPAPVPAVPAPEVPARGNILQGPWR
jgi:probable O-glycosylation ligase (exosortase A-associated)